MRSITVIVVMLALVGLTACANDEAAPAVQPETQSDSSEIASEDFESGEVEGVVDETTEAVESEVVEEDDDTSTP